MKNLTILVWTCVAGVVVSLGGGIYTAVQTHREREAQIRPVEQIALPATAPQ